MRDMNKQYNQYQNATADQRTKGVFPYCPEHDCVAKLNGTGL